MFQTYQNKQIFYHDLKNQNLIIRNNIQNKEYEKAEKYLEDLESENTMVMCEKRTGIPAVDILIACKIKEAMKHHIQVDVEAELLNATITEQELIAILGNGLDNAIEACKKMKTAPKWIRLHICNIKEMTMIKIENSYEQQPVQEKGHFISTKEEAQLHGLGVKSMRAIVEKYAGKMRMDYEDGVFSLMISFFH